MATLLESYTTSKNSFDADIQAAIPKPMQVLHQQEVLYRISVLEGCQMFAKAAPRSVDVKCLLWHYQMLDAYFQNLTMERKYGLGTGEDVQKRRDAAQGNLLNVIADYRKRFSSFSPGNDEGCYKKTITSVIQTVLPAWIQYRQTYVEIAKEAI